MKQDLQDRIRSMGHWRLNIRPLSPLTEKLTLTRSSQVVERSSVSLRGWDYPHISKNNNEHGGYGNVGDYVENWCDWSHHVEFWRMYRSAQFIHYKVLTEEMRSEGPGRPSGPVLSVLGAVYTVTEMVEFLSRLRQHGLYEFGAFLSITLGNTSNRQLWISETNRMPFIDEKKTTSSSIVIERHFKPDQFLEKPVAHALDMLLELFDNFGWTPDPSQILNDQEKFYRREW